MITSAPYDQSIMNLSFGELTGDEFERFRALIYRHAGIRIAPGKRVMVANRLRRRLRETGIASFSAYYQHLTSPLGGSELPRFLDAITTHETYFYRDKIQFDWFGETFLPAMAQSGQLRRRPRRLRIWSAACSTGEELYTLAIQIAARRSFFAGWKVTLLGTDLSGESLATARAGCFDNRAVRLIPPEQKTKFFDHDPNSGNWTINAEVRALPTWKPHNLLHRLNEEPFDCIFLKNVLIYFDEQSKRTAVRNLLAALAPGGYLVVGLTEGVHTMLDPLTKLKSWLYQRPESEAQTQARRDR